MNALIALLYLALCVLLFQICRVPFNRWTAPAAALGGIALVAGSVVTLDRYHPYASDARPEVDSWPIMAPVAGTVIEVAIEDGQRVRRGELLFRIDPEPLQLEVQSLETRVAQAQAGLAQVSAGAARELAQAQLAATRAELALARYRLEQTRVRAPADGRIVALATAPGQMIGAMSERPAMRLVDADPSRIVAALPPHRLGSIRPGLPAEIAFEAIPGRVFAAEVAQLVPAPESAIASDSDRVAVQLRIIDPDFDPTTTTGDAQAAIYGPQLSEVAILRKILLRMSAWLAYV